MFFFNEDRLENLNNNNTKFKKDFPYKATY